MVKELSDDFHAAEIFEVNTYFRVLTYLVPILIQVNKSNSSQIVFFVTV